MLFKGAAGDTCTAVPIWDMSEWSHPGGGAVTTASRSLCGVVKHNWLGHTTSHEDYDPESGSTLDGGATKVGEYVDTACSS